MRKTTSQERFTQLFAQSERPIYGFVFSLLPNHADAEDVVQETLTLLWDHFDEYDAARPFLPWACKFAYRQVLKARRRQRTDRRRFSHAVTEALAAEHPQQAEWNDAHRKALMHCVDDLDAEDRRILNARYFGEGSLGQLATEMGRTANSVYKQLQRIRAQLTNCVMQRLASEGSI